MQVSTKDSSILLANPIDANNAIQVAIGLILGKDNQMLLTYRPDYLPQGGHWEFPGGMVEDESIESALSRELKEELGITVLDKTLIAQVSYQLVHNTITLNAYLIDNYKGDTSALEGQKLRWVHIDKTGTLQITRPTFEVLRKLKNHHKKTTNKKTSYKKPSHLAIDVVKWKDVSKEIANVNPELAEAIELDDANPNFRLVKASYNYGDQITKLGHFCLPSKNGDTTSLFSDSISSDLQKMLSYSLCPIGLITKGHTELVFENETSLLPSTQSYQSDFIGLLTTLAHDKKCLKSKIVNIYSGLRTVFMLPKISDAIAHQRLVKEFNLTQSAPRNLSDHFHTFKQINDYHSTNKNKWTTDIYFFTKDWSEDMFSGKKLPHFNRYLRYKMGIEFQQTGDKIFFDQFWHFFVNELNKLNKRPSAHIVDAARHLIGMMIGIVPGLSVVSDINSLGPFENIQKAYIDTYRISHIPTVLGATFANANHDIKPLYFSMRTPLMINSYPYTQTTDSLITDLIQIQSVFNNFYTMWLTGELNIEGTMIEAALRKTKLEFYHSKPSENSHYEIMHTKNMPNSDPSLLKHPSKKRLSFTEASGILRCCIRLMTK